MIKRIQKLLGRYAIAFSSLISFKFKIASLAILLFLSIGSATGFAQGVSLAFSNGYLGTQGSNTNQANNIKKMSTLGIARISFGQSYLGSFGGTQGNDLSGTLKLYLNNGSVISLQGALNWRETTGSTVEVFGFILNVGESATISYGSSQTYTISGGSTNGTSTTIGLRAYASTYIFTDGENRSGNAATSGLLTALNAELTNSPQPSTITLTNPSVVEGNNLVYSVTLTSATTANVPQVYTFTKSGTATSAGDYTPTFTFSNGVIDNGDGTITVPGGVGSFTITVNTIDDVAPENTETLILGIGSKSATGSILDNDITLSTTGTLSAFNSCIGSASPAQSFTFSGTILSSTVTVTAPTGFEVATTQNGTYAASQVYTFGSSTVSATTVWVRAKSTATNGLSGNVTVATTGATTQNVAVSVVVNALPTITVSPSSSTIVTGNSVTLTASGASTYSWSPSSSLSASNTASVIASPTVTTTYTVTGTAASTCSNTASVTVTVNQALTAGAIATPQTICVGATPAALTSTTAASGGIGTITYQWESSTDNINFNPINSTNSATYSPGAVSVNTYYRRKASTATEGPVYTSSVMITVQESVGGTVSGSSIVCAGTNSTVLTLTGYTGSITKWQSALTANFSGTVSDILSSSASITATNLSATTYYRAIVTLGSCTSSTSGTASITVNALPTISVNVIPDVTTSAITFSIPYTGLSAGADLYSLTAGTSALSGFTPVSNAAITSSPLVITIPASVQNSYDFNLTIKNNTTGCSIQRAFNLVVSDMNPGTTASDQSICYGTIPSTFTSLTDATAGGAGSPTYQWQISTTGVTGVYTDILNATSASYTHPTALTADTYFRRKATIGSSFATAHPIEVLVNPLPVVTLTPASPEITLGSSITLTASGASSYSWTPSGGLSATNTSTVTATPTLTTTYTVTGTNSPSACTSTATVTVTVNPVLSAGAISANQTICVGGIPASLASTLAASGGTGSITYEWQSSTDGTNFTTIPGATSSTYSPGAISVNTYFRRGASTANDAIVYSSAVLITVQESVGGSIAGSATVCEGTNSAVLTLSGQTGSITKWQSSLTANFASVTDINSTTASITATNLSVTTYYRAVITLGSCSTENSTTASIVINPLPVITVTPATSSITAGTNVTLTASGATTYSWSPASGLSATNTAAVSASPSVTTTYTVTGTSSSCSSTATATVTVTAPVSLDTDGDGVLDSQETADGTNPNDVCSYVAASQTLTPTAAWANADCDGDGTPNGTDTAPKDPCVHAAGATPVTTNAIWRAADCDGDGVTNGKETDDGTDPNSGCSFTAASKTLTPTSAWGALDCDNDGNPNATDPNKETPTASNDVVTVGNSGVATINILQNDDFLPGPNTEITRQTGANAGTAKGTVTFNPLTGEMTYKRAPFESGLVTMGYRVTNRGVNPAVSSFAFVTILACDLADPLSDCDGDGEPNGTDSAPSDPCVYEPTRQVKANVSDDWKALDCDGDGVLNGTELSDGTNPSDGCSFKAGSITLAPSTAWLALDCDSDGITNEKETVADFDGDGIPNCLDTDSDGDSISDKLESSVDTDKDGKPDYVDLDSDNDGILDSVENKVCTGTGILCDTDADGAPNFRDLDSDSDKLNDVIEANGSDYNKDGIADGTIDEKGIPSSANKGLTPPDTDKDGKLDPYDVDSDGDGISDMDEEFNPDADFADCDRDGIPNRLDPDECDVFSPQGISPNGDGKNDRLVFKGLLLRKIPNHLSIYNRWGTLVYEMETYDNTFEGTMLPDGTYYYILDFFGKKPTISNYLSVDRTIK